MKVLILGGNGMLGPWTVESLEGRHELRVTDINEAPEGFAHEYRKVDVGVLDQVVDAAEGMDAIINLSVLRPHRQIAFDVNTRGNYNMAVAATTHGIRRLINTGPHFQLAGPGYEEFDFDLSPDMPPQPGSTRSPRHSDRRYSGSSRTASTSTYKRCSSTTSTTRKRCRCRAARSRDWAPI